MTFRPAAGPTRPCRKPAAPHQGPDLERPADPPTRGITPGIFVHPIGGKPHRKQMWAPFTLMTTWFSGAIRCGRGKLRRGSGASREYRPPAHARAARRVERPGDRVTSGLGLAPGWPGRNHPGVVDGADGALGSGPYHRARTAAPRGAGEPAPPARPRPRPLPGQRTTPRLLINSPPVRFQLTCGRP